MIFHSTFVQNELDSLIKEVPELVIGMREENDTFILILPSSFDDLPTLARVSAFHGINNMMKRLTAAGIRVSMERTDMV
jgi:hypothetical protein